MTNYPELTDAALLELARTGDKTAETELVLRYRRVVRVCARPYFLAGGDSEDLLQEGMIGLLSAMREFDPQGGASFRTYAETCVRRRVISAARGASRRKHSPLNDGVSLDDVLDQEGHGTAFSSGRFDRSPEDRLLAREFARDFSKAYARYLSPFESEILNLYLDGLSYGEIAARSGRSVKSVDNAVQRIRKKLARHLTHGDFS